MQVVRVMIMNNPFIAEVISAKSEAESDRLTAIEQAKLKKIRDAELTQAIEKINAQRKCKGDRIVFRTDEDYARAGMSILKKYNATDSEKTWFLSLI